jgi:hypothetical protein
MRAISRTNGFLVGLGSTGGPLRVMTQLTAYAGPDDRQDRRQEEGLTGEDKRECKQEDVRDGVRGNQGERFDGDNGDDDNNED